MKRAAIVIAALFVALAAVLGVAELRWRSATSGFVSRLGTGGTPPQGVFSFAEVDTLPEPVRAYFRAVLREGQPIARRCRMIQRGEILLEENKKQWGPFTAVEYFSSRPAGFVWDVRVRMAPGIPVRGRDGFVQGSGFMRVSIVGLVPVVTAKETRELAEGALLRYLAEAVWCPTMLLPSAGVVWTPLDERAARGTLEAGGITVALDFHFGADNLVQSAFTASRPYEKNGVFVPMPWEGRFSDYEERDGMSIPIAVEAAWLLPEGEETYWRGRIVEIVYGEGSW